MTAWMVKALLSWLTAASWPVHAQDGAPVENACPCEDAELCKTPTVQHKEEFFGFGGKFWENYHWDIVTTLAWVDDPEAICTAHKNNARVIAHTPPFSFPMNETERSGWIVKLLDIMRTKFQDGVTFDYEEPMDKSPDSPTAEDMLEYVALVKETTETLHREIPGSQVSVCVPWSPDDIDGRNYNFLALADASDLLYVMVYDTRSQIFDKCIASANAPLALAKRGLERYLQLGVEKEKLVLGTPWYGYVYPCINSGPSDEICQIPLVPFRGASCSDAAGAEVAYMHIMNLLDTSTCPPGSKGGVCKVTTEVRMDTSTQSPYFNFVETLPNGTEQLYQMWFDDPVSSALKYREAALLGVRGVGPFMWGYLDEDGTATANPKAYAESEAMWAAMKAFRQASDPVVVN